MIITPLGHTEFLVDIKNPQGENVRILGDTWLSDFAVGDLMERTTKVRLDPEKISTIDAIYISHAHTDHFDPYTLMEIYGSCHSDEGRICSDSPERLSRSFVPQDDKSKKPLLLLPFTLAYLVPLIREYLGDICIEIVSPKKSYVLKGIEITGYMFSQSEITNEDDVMMLAVGSDRELLFAEIDTLPDEGDTDVQAELYRILTRKDYVTVCYLASRNCLDAALPALDMSPNKRGTYIREYKSEQKEEIRFSYEKYTYEEFDDMENIYTIPGFVRGFIGQGIAYPERMSPELFSLPIFPLADIASLHTDLARTSGYDFSQKALLPGRQYKVEDGNIETGRKECPIGEFKIQNSKFKIQNVSVISTESPVSVATMRDPALNNVTKEVTGRIYASGPLFPRDVSVYSKGLLDEKNRILDVLNHRFLPYWSASPVASLRDALLKNNGTYRIQLRTTNYELPIILEYSLTRSGFVEVPYAPELHIDESYWLDDILDFLDGRQELYSNFWHKLDTKKVYRLWTCLGANFCNNDLVLNKYRLHFERASRGETAETFFEEMKKSLQS